MNSTSDLDLLLSTYADGELDPELVNHVEEIIATDPAARLKVAIHRESTALLRAACAERIYANAAIDRVLELPQRRIRAGWRIGWAVAASIVFGIAGFGAGSVWSGLATNPRDHVLDEVAEYHEIFSRETRHLAEVPADQRDHIKAWLGQRLEHPFQIPDLSSVHLRFAGARMLVLDGSPVADLIYTRENGLPIAFCILKSDGRPMPVQVSQRGELNLVSWGNGKLGFVVVGEIEKSALRSIADQILDQTSS